MRIIWLPLACALPLNSQYFAVWWESAWGGISNDFTTVLFAARLSTYALDAFFVAVAMVGLYRYLLRDPRFRMGALNLRNDLGGGPRGVVPFYFRVDAGVLALALILASLMGLSLLGPQAVYGVAGMIAGAEQVPAMRLYFYSTKAWAVFCFFLATQLCLVYPGIASCANIRAADLWANVKNLGGNRLRVFAVAACLYAAIFIVPRMLAAETLGLVLAKDQAAHILPYVSAVLRGVCLAATAVFYATLFRSSGAPATCK